MAFGFEQIGGLIGALALVPFIIVYLIKPRPVKLPVPSLMFFMRKTRATTKESFLRVFQKDYLFFIQLAVLLLLILSLAYPYFSKQEDVVSKNLVFVLDVSASSQVIENTKTRFEISKEKIAILASDSNTVILAKSSPVIAAKNIKKSELQAFLNRLQPTEDESRIGDTLLLAGETVGSEKARIIAVSDFINTRGVSVNTAVDILKSKDITVDMINTALSRHNNLAITSLIADEDSTSVYIRNYNPSSETVNLDIDGTTTQLNVDSNNAEQFTYKTKEGLSKIEIKNKDDFMVDNIAYASNPAGAKIRVYYVTNFPSKFLVAALNSSTRIQLFVVEPPVIPKEKADVYIIGKIGQAKLLPGTFEDIAKQVNEGSSAVITAYEGIDKLSLNNLANIKFNSTKKTSSIETTQITRFTKDIEFSPVKSAYSVTDIKGEIIAESEGTPIIVYSQYGKGNIVYYGILEKESSFQLSPDYPVFWTSLIKYLVNAKEMSELNIKTGTSFLNENGDEVIADKTGVFNISSNEIAVNLINDQESAINPGEDTGTKITNFKFTSVSEEVKTPILDCLLIISLILVIFEIYYVRKRGAL